MTALDSALAANEDEAAGSPPSQPSNSHPDSPSPRTGPVYEVQLQRVELMELVQDFFASFLGLCDNKSNGKACRDLLKLVVTDISEHLHMLEWPGAALLVHVLLKLFESQLPSEANPVACTLFFCACDA